jgi:hypothetical protein
MLGALGAVGAAVFGKFPRRPRRNKVSQHGRGTVPTVPTADLTLYQSVYMPALLTPVHARFRPVFAPGPPPRPGRLRLGL